MREYRAFFDRQEEATRRAYYHVGNFECGRDMKEAVCAGKIAVCDRFYASTMAYSLALDASVPEEGDEVYQWPAELYKPDLMVLLTLPEEQRQFRIQGRFGIEVTAEEKRLAGDEEFRERVVRVYRNLGCVEVSAAGSQQEVVDRLVEQIRMLHK